MDWVDPNSIEPVEERKDDMSSLAANSCHSRLS